MDDDETPKARSWFGLVVLVLVLAGLVKIAIWIGLAIAIAVLLVLLWRSLSRLDKWLDRREAKRDVRKHSRMAIAARADEQNRLFIAGDPRGVYGDFPPAIRM